MLNYVTPSQVQRMIAVCASGSIPHAATQIGISDQALRQFIRGGNVKKATRQRIMTAYQEYQQRESGDAQPAAPATAEAPIPLGMISISSEKVYVRFLVKQDSLINKAKAIGDAHHIKAAQQLRGHWYWIYPLEALEEIKAAFPGFQIKSLGNTEADIPEGMRRCEGTAGHPGCGKVKPEGDFNRNGSTPGSSYRKLCKECQRLQVQAAASKVSDNAPAHLQPKRDTDAILADLSTTIERMRDLFFELARAS